MIIIGIIVTTRVVIKTHQQDSTTSSPPSPSSILNHHCTCVTRLRLFLASARLAFLCRRCLHRTHDLHGFHYLWRHPVWKGKGEKSGSGSFREQSITVYHRKGPQTLRTNDTPTFDVCTNGKLHGSFGNAYAHRRAPMTLTLPSLTHAITDGHIHTCCNVSCERSTYRPTKAWCG